MAGFFFIRAIDEVRETVVNRELCVNRCWATSAALQIQRLGAADMCSIERQQPLPVCFNWS